MVHTIIYFKTKAKLTLIQRKNDIRCRLVYDLKTQEKITFKERKCRINDEDKPK